MANGALERGPPNSRDSSDNAAPNGKVLHFITHQTQFFNLLKTFVCIIFVRTVLFIVYEAS